MPPNDAQPDPILRPHCQMRHRHRYAVRYRLKPEGTDQMRQHQVPSSIANPAPGQTRAPRENGR
jgi:hypothetical protein